MALHLIEIGRSGNSLHYSISLSSQYSLSTSNEQERVSCHLKQSQTKDKHINNSRDSITWKKWTHKLQEEMYKNSKQELLSFGISEFHMPAYLPGVTAPA